MANKRSTYLPYLPGHPPTADPATVVRATWDELHRISQSLIDLDKPVALTAIEQQVFTVGNPGPWTDLFIGADAQWERPSGQLDTLTGQLTIVQEGLYLIFVVLRIPAFSTPASKEYEAQLQTTITKAGGSPITTWIDAAGGIDTFPITVQTTIQLPFSPGDTLGWSARIYHATKTGTITCGAHLFLHRISGIK